MPRPLAPDQLAAVPSLDLVEEEVSAGLESHRERMHAALTVEDYYRLRNEQHLERRPAESDTDFASRPKRTSAITRAVVRKLADPLYRPGPTRELQGDATASKWLESAYAAALANARLLSANRASILHGVCAIQAEATGHPERPVRLWLWRPHELAVWCRDGDPEEPWAVCTRDVVEAEVGKLKTRYRLWSAAELRVYETKPYSVGDTAGGKRAKRVEAGPSPYLGVLPFSFVRDEPAEEDFWAKGIGEALSRCNAEIDRELSDLAEHLQWFLNPTLYGRNLPATTRFINKCGQINMLPMAPGAADGDRTNEADVFALQVQLGVEQGWLNLRHYADQTLEELDVPVTAIRSDASTDLSGIAIVAKSIPLVEFTRARQPQFQGYEQDLASTVLAVAGAWYRQPGLTAAATTAELLLTWPEAKIPLPTPERDDADQRELDLGLSDPIEVIARRRGLTLQQAEVVAEGIAERRKTWDRIWGGAPPVPAPVAIAQAKAEQDDDDAEEPDDTPER